MQPTIVKANDRRERYSLSAVRNASASAWDAHFWAKGVAIGLHSIEIALLEAGVAGVDLDDPKRLARFLRRFRYPKFIREDLSVCAARALERYRKDLALWVERGMVAGREPTID